MKRNLSIISFSATVLKLFIASLIFITPFFVTSCTSTLATIYQEDWYDHFFFYKRSLEKSCLLPASPHYNNERLIYGRPGDYQCVCQGTKPVCGYHCLFNESGTAKCAQYPGQTCVLGSSGHIACGYNCKQTPREARCAVRYGDTCVVDLYNHIKCGLNCRVENGFVKCDPSPSWAPWY